MILTKEIKIKTANKNITYYKSLGFDIKSGDEITIKPEQLPDASIQKVDVKCDICGNIKKITMFSYRRNINNYGYYSCSVKCSKDKTIKTNLDKYGVVHYNKTDEFIKKIKKTKKERYGNENYTNIKKQKETNLKKYGKEYYIQTDDFKNKKDLSLMNKYGTVIPLQNEDIKNKWIQTNLDKYNVMYPLQNEDIKNKSLLTKKEKYNDINYNNRDKYKNTCIIKYGYDNPMKNEEIKDKLYESFYEKYGERHPMHVQEFVDKMIKSGIRVTKYKDSELYYQSTYEKDFLDKYYNVIDIDRGKSIKYIYNDKEHIYYPDFYIKELNLIIEIKSTNWYNIHEEKNIVKKEYCIKNGYNFMFIIDKNYDIFDKLIKYKLYQKEDVCYQYKIKIDNKISDNTQYNNLKVSDFKFNYIDSSDKSMCNRIRDFIVKYEWLGKMPNRPTHRFVAMYGDEIGAVIIMATPNSFSKILGENTKDIEKLISRGANAHWTPKNLSSSLIMWSIKWMVNNTNFRLFSAYSDTEAKEIGTIYQSCNFIYLGKNFGSDYVYFDLNNPNIGWTSGRNFRKVSYYKRVCKRNNIEWSNNWNNRFTVLWDNIPKEIIDILKTTRTNDINNLIKRKSPKKHKYIYILGRNKKETNELMNIFYINNPNYKKLKYPKRKDG